MRNKKILSNILNWIGFLTIVIFAALLIARVWSENKIINKLTLTDVILFGAVSGLYWIMSYEEDKTKKS